MPRKPQQQRSKATVEAIIEAGFICVAEQGARHTTTRHIADKAGISVGSLYEYFSNKQMIFDAMNQRVVADVVKMIQPMMAELVQMPVEDTIRTVLKAFETLLRQNNDRYLVCVRGAIRVDLKEYMDPITRILGDLLAQHFIHHPENLRIQRIPAMTYFYVNGAIFAVVKHLSDPSPPITFDQLVEGLATMLGHYIAHEQTLLAS